MNNTPLVSVGIPTYNRADSLRQAVESVLAQGYSNLELVISDNGSTDHTKRVCEEFCARDNRVTYIRQSTNRGPHANFREVLRHARGEMFMWLGDDDWLDHGYVEQCAQVLVANPDYSVVCGASKFFHHGEFLLNGETINLLQSSAAERVLAYYAQVDHNTVFYGVMRREQVQLVRPPNVLGGDWLLIASMAFMGKIETLQGESINRSWEGASRDLKTLTATIGVSDLHTHAPHLSIAIAAFVDIVWLSEAYASLGLVARLSLACRVLAVFFRKYFRPYWRDTIHPYWTRSILFALSIRDRLRKRYVR